MFAERAPNYRAENVADEVHGDGEDELLLGCDAVGSCDERDGHRGQRGAHC